MIFMIASSAAVGMLRRMHVIQPPAVVVLVLPCSSWVCTSCNAIFLQDEKETNTKHALDQRSSNSFLSFVDTVR